MSEDLISRQAAIDAIDEYIENNRRPDFIGNLVWVSGVADAMRIVSELPSVQERKGRWLRYGEDGYPNEKDTVAWQCDQCLTTYYGRTERIPNYCPNCGAKMEGEQDDND